MIADRLFLSPLLRTIADLSAEAEWRVEQARGGRDASPPGGYTTEQDKAFDATIQALDKEDNVVATSASLTTDRAPRRGVDVGHDNASRLEKKRSRRKQNPTRTQARFAAINRF
jgi:hypothetical protein